MKISDIVKVNITNVPSFTPNTTQMNSVAAVLFVHRLQSGESGTTDTAWRAVGELGTGYIGEDILDRIEETYRLNGGVSLVFKRIYLATGATDNEALAIMTNAIKGGAGQTALDVEVKNVQLAWSNTFTPAVGSLADALIDANAPENTKILFVTSNATPSALTLKQNVFWHYSVSSGTFVNYYESAAAMAYLSKINYNSDEVQDYEYTEWLGSSLQINLVDNKPSEAQGKVNIFTSLANRNVLIGGVLTNGVRLITYYFELILTERITNSLALLTLNKLKFDQTTYATLYNAITIELDVFANNGLLDTSFTVQSDEIIFRDGNRFVLVEQGQILNYGYSVNVLPPTADDLTTRNYTGLYIHFAISNQIRTIQVSGLALGGIN
jgi:hypothetical protein